MQRVFFSHASEDKAIVEHIYARIAELYPDIKPWLDKYEIVGGESLIDKIAEGINAADKFVIFLSPTSVMKPWVNRELRKAIMMEISEARTFIIPVILGKLPKVPDFLEEKLYLELGKMTETEFLTAIHAAITGVMNQNQPSTVENLETEVTKRDSYIQVFFGVRYWSEYISFAISLDKPFTNVVFAFGRRAEPGLRTAFTGPMFEEKDGTIYRICLPEARITPETIFVVQFEFNGLQIDSDDVNVTSVEQWNEGFTKPMSAVMRT